MNAPGPVSGDVELDWLLAACRAFLGGPGPSAPPADWRRLGRLAYLHQLEPLLSRLLSQGRLAADGLPEAIERAWEGTLYRNFTFNTELLERASRIVAACRRRSLRIALFKGPVTAARGYGALELRIMADLDLLCHPDDVGPVAAVVREAGFEATEQTADYHLGFLLPELGAGLELHFALYARLPGRRALLEEICTRPETLSIDGVDLPAPTRETALVLDVAHLLQHDLRVQLRLLLDLAATWQAGGEAIGDRRVLEALRRSRLDTEAGHLFDLLGRRFGWPLARGLPAPAGSGQRFGDAVIERLRSVDRLAERALLDGPHDRGGPLQGARYLWRRLFPPLGHLAALHGAPSRWAALRHLPRHQAVTLRRALDRLRGGGLRDRTTRSLEKPADRRRP